MIPPIDASACSNVPRKLYPTKPISHTTTAYYHNTGSRHTIGFGGHTIYHTFIARPSSGRKNAFYPVRRGQGDSQATGPESLEQDSGCSRSSIICCLSQSQQMDIYWPSRRRSSSKRSGRKHLLAQTCGHIRTCFPSNHQVIHSLLTSNSPQVEE